MAADRDYPARVSDPAAPELASIAWLTMISLAVALPACASNHPPSPASSQTGCSSQSVPATPTRA